MSTTPQQIGAVAIARNEGERLKNCLRSLTGKCATIVYVDSGSTDRSVEFAKSLGVEVVELDMSKPFSMARARNAGFARLREILPTMKYVQFVDGDCELDPNWLPTGTAWLDSHSETVAVCGRRRERFPEKSIYNQICDIEWNTPVGPAKSCGGDALMRVATFAASGGYSEQLIAGEEPELCLRLRNVGGKIDRIDAEMTRHDAAILTFAAWWKRTLRGGYGALDVFTRLRGKVPDADVPFHHLTTSAASWTDRWLILVAIIVAIAVLIAPAGNLAIQAEAVAVGFVIGIGLQFFQAFRIGLHVRNRTSFGNAMIYGIFTMIGKWAQRAGQRRYGSDVRAGRVIKIIEYKQ